MDNVQRYKLINLSVSMSPDFPPPVLPSCNNVYESEQVSLTLRQFTLLRSDWEVHVHRVQDTFKKNENATK